MTYTTSLASNIEEMYAKGFYKEIVEEYRAENDSDRYFVGASFYKLGEFEKAVAILENVEKEHLEESQFLLVSSFLSLSDTFSAYKVVKRMKSTNMRREAKFEIASFHLKEGSIERAKKILESLVSSYGSKYYNACFKLGMINFDELDYKSAISNLERCLSNKDLKDMGLIIYTLGMCHEKIGNTKKATYFFTKSAEKVGKYSLSSAISMMNLKFGTSSEFLFWLNKAISIAIQRNDLRGFDSIINYLIKKDKRDLAMEVLNSYSISNSYAAEKKVDILVDFDMFEEALEEIGKSDLCGDKRDYLECLIFFNLGNYEMVVKKGVKLKDIESMLRVSWAYLFLEDYSSSLAAFNNLKERGIKDAFYGILVIMAKMNTISKSFLKEFREVPFSREDYEIFDKLMGYVNNRSTCLILIDELLNRDSSDETLNRVMKYLLDLEDYNLVLSYAERFSSDSAKNFYKGLAKINLGEDSYQYLKLSSEDPKYREHSLYLLFDSFFSSGSYDAALNYSSLYLQQKFMNHRDEILEKASMIHLKRGDIEQAKKLINKITNKERAHLLISDLYFNTGEYTKSARKYLNFLKKYPGSEYVPEVLFSLSQIFYNTESYELAKVYLEKLLDVDSPFRYEALYSLGIVSCQIKDFENAIRSFEKFFSQNSSRVDNWIEYIAVFVFEKGFSTEYRERFLRLANSLNREKVRLETLRMVFAGKVEGDIEDFRSLVNSNYKEEALDILLSYYLAIQNYDRAIFVIYSTKTKDSSLSSLIKALKHSKRGEFEESISILRTLKLKNSSFRDKIYFELANCYKNLGDETSYLEILIDFAERFKSSILIHKVLDDLVDINVKRRNNSEAKKYFFKLKGVNNEAAEKYVDAINF